MKITVSLLPTSAVKITIQHNHVTKTQMEYAYIYWADTEEYFGDLSCFSLTRMICSYKSSVILMLFHTTHSSNNENYTMQIKERNTSFSFSANIMTSLHSFYFFVL